jgi:SAM-dependent methyltransferase
LRDGGASLAVLFHVLEHLPDPAALLREVGRVLGPGGDLVILVPNAASLQARVLGPRWLGWDPPRHLVHFTPQRLKTLLRQCGFAPAGRPGWCPRDDAGAWAVSLASGWYAPVRAARGRSGRVGGWGALLGMLGLSAAFLPVAAAEAALGRAGMLMVHARCESGRASLQG